MNTIKFYELAQLTANYTDTQIQMRQITEFRKIISRTIVKSIKIKNQLNRFSNNRQLNNKNMTLIYCCFLLNKNTQPSIVFVYFNRPITVHLTRPLDTTSRLRIYNRYIYAFALVFVHSS